MRQSSDIRLLQTRVIKLARAMVRRDYRQALLRHQVLAASEHVGAPLRARYGTVLDVGASRGQFALFASRTWPSADLICVEPLSKPAGTLRQVLQGKGVVVQAGLGSAAGTSTMNVSARDDSSSMLDMADQVNEYPDTYIVSTEQVEITTVDQLMARSDPRAPVLLKIDVQGYEMEVLRGAQKSFSQIGSVLCECSFVELYAGQPLAHEIVGYMAGYGFRLAGFANLSLGANGAAIQADLIFENPSI